MDESLIPPEYNEIGGKSVDNNVVRYIDQFILCDSNGKPIKLEDIGKLNTVNANSKVTLFGSVLKPLPKQYKIKPRPQNYISVKSAPTKVEPNSTYSNRRVSMGTLHQVSEHEREKVFLYIYKYMYYNLLLKK